MIAYVIGYISLVVVPLLCIWYVSKMLGSVSQFWSILKRAAIVAPLALWVAFKLCNLTQFVGLHPNEVTDFLSAAEVAFWAAGLPEEMAKLVIVGLLLWWNYRKGMSIDTKTIIICVCMVGAFFAMYENLFNSYPHAGKFLSRHWSFVGHFCYCVIMGYGCSLFLNKRSRRTLYVQAFICCLLLPMTMHACFDFCVFALRISTGLQGKAIFLFGDIATMTANIWIALRCIKQMRYDDRKINHSRSIDV